MKCDYGKIALQHLAEVLFINLYWKGGHSGKADASVSINPVMSIVKLLR